MAIIKCKMCGGDLNVVSNESVVECEYCGSRQTIFAADDEKKLTLFARANRLRIGCEFDKAAGVYEAIVAEFPEEAEAYWGLVLCKFGVEYVDDPATGKKIPTCHRSSFSSVMEDNDFEQAQENADAIARKQYREEAKQIEELRRGIISVSANEQPYDIFICYKETDENGDRTPDSVLAQDIYDALTDRGYRVFFSRISLEDKLGTEFEPYIFAALNSAKIMLAVGTDYEYYNAVWVKNEWSRYLKLMAQDKEKRLIPCYKDIDAYDIPREFARLQAQDMGKLGALQDLIRGVEKLLPLQKDAQATVVREVVTQVENPGVAPLLRRVFMFLEDGDWPNADAYCEKVLDAEPENGEAYLGKLMAQLKVKKRELLAEQKKPFDNESLFQKAVRYGDENLKNELNDTINVIKRRIAETREARRSAEEKRLDAYVADITRKLEAQRQIYAENERKIIGAGARAKKASLAEISRLELMLEGMRRQKSRQSDLRALMDFAEAVGEHCSIGDYVKFGAYPQTKDGTDITPIEWLVLARDGDKALLLSRYALDTQPYNTKYTSVTWESCTLRKWLNNDFINCAFTAEEQSVILVTNVDNGDSQGFDFTTVSKYAEKVTGGNDTQDKIFLLSYAEANQYLGVTLGDRSNTRARVAPTAYAIAHGAGTLDSIKTADGEGAGWWWLRSPGGHRHSASRVDRDGSLDSSSVDYGDRLICPALWVNLES